MPSPSPTIGLAQPADLTLLAWIPVVTAAIALIAAVAAWITARAASRNAAAASRNAENSGRAVEVAGRAAEASRRAGMANLLASLHPSYGSDPFREALQLLRKFAKDSQNPGGFAEEYGQLLSNEDPFGKRLDAARRLLARHFEMMKAFGRTGIIDGDLLAEIFGESDVRFVVEILDPIDRKHQAVRGYPYDQSTRTFFEDLLKTHYPRIK
jgi:hypothetical protein